MKTAILTASLALCALPAAHADDVAILSAAAVRPALIEVPALFTQATGHRVTVNFGNATAIQNRVAAGDPVDLVILPPQQLDSLLALLGNRTALGVVRLGIAARAASPRPPVGTPDDFKRALLAAPSFGMPDPVDGSTSSTYLVKLLQQLGIADQMKVKTILFPDGTKALEAVAKGEIALTVAPTTSIRAVSGVALVGPLPEVIQLKTTYAAALTRRSVSLPAANALLQILTSPAVTTLFQQKGIDPP